jgi:hypothetical protein
MRALPVGADPRRARPCAVTCAPASRPRTKNLALGERPGDPRRLFRPHQSRSSTLPHGTPTLSQPDSWVLGSLSACIRPAVVGVGDTLSESTSSTIYQTSATPSAPNRRPATASAKQSLRGKRRLANLGVKLSNSGDRAASASFTICRIRRNG